MDLPPPISSFLPFVLLLLAIAVFPLLPRVSHWWEHNSRKLLVSLLLAAATLAFYAFLHAGVREAGDPATLHTGFAAVVHVAERALFHEYVPFIVLLFSLYTISGGILLEGDIEARPAVNCAFLAAGAVLASFIGTTGASMLLIRPLLRTNSERRLKVHTVVFFIFLVSNIGGLLTPLGDPPLFLGYLRGVPFWHTMTFLGPWAFTTLAALAIYFVWDSIAYRRERPADVARDERQVRPLALSGGINLFWLLAVVAVVAAIDPSRAIPFFVWRPFAYFREGLLLIITALSWFTTPRNREIRAANRFSFAAIGEVACLFAGIFICMQPPVEYLQARGGELGLDSAPAYFWATGALSGFLDNAPTYVVFFETARALTADLVAAGSLAPADLVTLALPGGGSTVISADLLRAVSLGAVFMGANTYIGNGPNFMVKSIADQAGVRMPSFFGYMAYSVAILVPIFFAVMLLFL